MDTWSENGEEVEHVVMPAPTIFPSKKTTANRNLLQKIEAILGSYELQEKYSIQLTVYSLAIIEKLIKTKPEFFRIVESTLVRNINGSTLYANDVPYIISIISQLYMVLANSKIDLNSDQELPADTCGHLLKFIINVAIREKVVKIDDETEATLLILCCDNLIDACTKLIKLKPIENKIEPVKPVVKEVEKTDCCC
jgi:hypothetical protein